MLCKFSQFDTRLLVLCDRKADMLLTCSSPAVAHSNTLKSTLSLPTPMAVRCIVRVTLSKHL